MPGSDKEMTIDEGNEARIRAIFADSLEEDLLDVQPRHQAERLFMDSRLRPS